MENYAARVGFLLFLSKQEKDALFLYAVRGGVTCKETPASIHSVKNIRLLISVSSEKKAVI